VLNITRKRAEEAQRRRRGGGREARDGCSAFPAGYAFVKADLPELIVFHMSRVDASLLSRVFFFCLPLLCLPSKQSYKRTKARIFIIICYTRKKSVIHGSKVRKSE
jgi:hypothetical protein